MEIGKVIRRPPVSVLPGMTMREAASTLIEENVGALLVTQSGRLLGIVSERDLAAAIADGADLDETVEAFMAADPYTVGAETAVAEAARLMQDKGIRHLPVTDASGVRGVVSVRDLLGAALAQTAHETKLDWPAEVRHYLSPQEGSSPADGG
jgi:CBS domain-containing protein